MRQLKPEEIVSIITESMSVMLGDMAKDPFRSALVYYSSYQALMRSCPADNRVDLIACVAQLNEKWNDLDGVKKS